MTQCDSQGEAPTASMAEEPKNPEKASVAPAQRGMQASRWDEGRMEGGARSERAFGTTGKTWGFILKATGTV